MNKFFIKTLCLKILLLLAVAYQATAQEGISAKDKATLKAIFKDVPKDQYKLSFNGGKEVYGTKQIRMADLKRVSKSSDRATLAAFTFIVADRSENEVIYIYSEGLDKVASMLGKRKFAQLKTIMDKYEPQRSR